METAHKQIVLGILAHVDSGKTTLSEAMLYRSGAIRKLGRVDHKDAFLDTDTLEKARGITIFSKQALLTAGNTDITLLDTPGHVDFTVEVEVGLDFNLREDVYASAYGHVGSDGGCSLDADTGKADTDAHTEMVEDSMVIYSTFLG